MIPAPTRYLDALRHSHEAHLRVTLHDDSGPIGKLPVVSLTLTVDGNALVRRTGTMAIGLDPYGTASRDIVEQINVQSGHVVIEHGIAWPGLDIDWVQIARMRIADTAHATPGATRTIELYDWALLIQEHKFPTVWPLDDPSPPPPQPRPYVDLITQALAETLPDATLIIDPTLNVTTTPSPGQAFGRGEDRLGAIRTMAEGLDADFFNDPNGDFVLVDATPNTTVVWEVDAGSEGVLISVNEQFSRQEQYNAVGLTFTNPTAPEAYVYVWDDDPASPTYYDGPFGKRPIFLSEEYAHIPNQTRAINIALRRLDKYSGATRSLSLQTVYNPLLQPGDRIRVRWPDGTAETQIIDTINLSMGDSAVMTINTRLARSPSVFAQVVG